MSRDDDIELEQLRHNSRASALHIYNEALHLYPTLTPANIYQILTITANALYELAEDALDSEPTQD